MSLHEPRHGCLCQAPVRGSPPCSMKRSNRHGRLFGTAFREINLTGCPSLILGHGLTSKPSVVDRLQEWIRFREAKEALSKLKVLPVLHEVLSGEITVEEAGESYLARFYRVWLDAAYSSDATFARVPGGPT